MKWEWPLMVLVLVGVLMLVLVYLLVRSLGRCEEHLMGMFRDLMKWGT